MNEDAVRPRFMGHEHVAKMNALLQGRLLRECAAFERDVAVQYEITGDPEGIRLWTVTVGPSGVRFGLDVEAVDPVLVVRDTYQAMAEMSAATRAGEVSAHLPDHDMRDPEAFAMVDDVITASRAIAVVDVQFPST